LGEGGNIRATNEVIRNTSSFEFPLPQEHPSSAPPAGLWLF